MNLKLKAVLLSLFAFPGAGQFLIKKPVAGILYLGVALLSFGVILMAMIQRSLLIAEKVQLGEIPLDVSTISALILQQQESSGDYFVNIAWIMLILTWLISIIHLSLAKLE